MLNKLAFSFAWLTKNESGDFSISNLAQKALLKFFLEGGGSGPPICIIFFFFENWPVLCARFKKNGFFQIHRRSCPWLVARFFFCLNRVQTTGSWVVW